jgi:beta-fructofuranosidase
MRTIMKGPLLPRFLLGLLAFFLQAGHPGLAAAASYSLADDFSYTDNRSDSTWSYRLDDLTNASPAFPLLTSTERDANQLWGSDFPTPPKMWSEASGYWGIGKNTTTRELFSSRNGTKWAPNEVLFHPKAGRPPSLLVVGWRAPSNLVIEVHYALGQAAEQGNGIGYEIMKRSGGIDAPIVALGNIGTGLSNSLTGLVVSRSDQLFFRFDPRGDPAGDISRANIMIDGVPWEGANAQPSRLAGGTVAAGSDFTFSIPAAGARTFRWRKDGQPITGATNSSYQIKSVKLSDAGAYSVLLDAKASQAAVLKVTPRPLVLERFASLTPRQVFSGTLAAQEQELRTNQLMRRFAASRQRQSADPYRPAYHFVSPESQLNDPNGLCFWQGRWHMFYQAYPPDEFPQPKDIAKRRQHWGHAVSEDLVHWQDLPYAIYPGMERMCFSGSTVVEQNQVVAFYPGIGAGQMVAVSKDPLLLNWEKIEGNPVIGGGGDSCIWKEGDTYCGLIGRGLWTSTNLVNWAPGGEFFSGAEGSCPNFLPIGSKHIILGFSHGLGGHYLLGNYDQAKRRFSSYAQGRFNHGTVSPGGVHAPSAASDGKGGVINILNINDGRQSDDWDQIMSLAQHLSLGEDQRLRIEPVEAIASLRTKHRHIGETVLPANQELVLDSIRGNALELEVEIDPQLSRWVQLNVLRSPNSEEQTSITFYNFNRKLSIWYDTKAVICLDGSRSSTLPDAWTRPPERVEVDYGSRDWGSAPTATTPGKPLKLRVFIDRSVVEVFVNDKHYLATRVYPGRKDSLGVSLRAQGQAALLKKLNVWEMKSIGPGAL